MYVHVAKNSDCSKRAKNSPNKCLFADERRDIGTKRILHECSCLLNLFDELGKSDKMRGLPSILLLFRNEFNKFNNTGARMLDCIHHMTTTLKSHFWRKDVIILSLCKQRCYGRHKISRKSINR